MIHQTVIYQTVIHQTVIHQTVIHQTVIQLAAPSAIDHYYSVQLIPFADTLILYLSQAN